MWYTQAEALKESGLMPWSQDRLKPELQLCCWSTLLSGSFERFDVWRWWLHSV